MRARPVEPVHRAPHCNQVNGRFRQRRLFGTSFDDLKPGLVCCQFTARFQHFGIRFDRQHAMPGFEEEFRQHAGARADVGDDRTLRQRAMLTQERKNAARKPWTIREVRLHAP